MMMTTSMTFSTAIEGVGMIRVHDNDDYDDDKRQLQ